MQWKDDRVSILREEHLFSLWIPQSKLLYTQKRRGASNVWNKRQSRAFIKLSESIFIHLPKGSAFPHTKILELCSKWQKSVKAISCQGIWPKQLCGEFNSFLGRGRGWSQGKWEGMITKSKMNASLLSPPTTTILKLTKTTHFAHAPWMAKSVELAIMFDKSL